MPRALLTAFVLFTILAAPGLALTDFRADATNLTWFIQRTTAEINEIRDALLWQYDRQQTIDGLVAQAARPSFTVTSLGGGNSELSITMPLTAGNAWVTAMALTPCPAANTTALRRSCVNTLLAQDFKRLWQSYKVHLREISTPVATVPDP